MPDDRRRMVVFAFIAICVCGVAVPATRSTPRAERRPSRRRPVSASSTNAAERDAIPVGERVLFRNTALGQGYGQVSPGSACELGRRPLHDTARVRAGRLCRWFRLVPDRGSRRLHEVSSAHLRRAFQRPPHTGARRHSQPHQSLTRTAGSPPSRSSCQVTRIRRDRSRRLTTLIDTASGAVLADLEQFAVTRDGKPFKAVDFNFWGVTFAADSNTFYATLGTGSEQLLIRGDAGARRAVVLRGGVECPAISPDGTRLAFKQRTTVDGVFGWRLATLDLQTLTDRLVPGELRSIDDQVEWLDDRSPALRRQRRRERAWRHERVEGQRRQRSGVGLVARRVFAVGLATRPAVSRRSSSLTDRRRPARSCRSRSRPPTARGCRCALRR